MEPEISGYLNNGAQAGIDQLLHSGSIVVVTLTTCLILALIGNIVQYWVGNRRQDKDHERHVALGNAIKDVAFAVHEMKTVFNFLVDLYKEGKDENH